MSLSPCNRGFDCPGSYDCHPDIRSPSFLLFQDTDGDAPEVQAKTLRPDVRTRGQKPALAIILFAGRQSTEDPDA